MFKNLDGEVFGIFSRQNEVIEIALTHSFRGISVDLADMQNRADAFDQHFATRFIKSAREALSKQESEDSPNFFVGEFRLPVDVTAADADYKKQLERLDTCCQLAKEIGATRCYTNLSPGSADHAYHENFEQHRERLGEVADLLQKYDIMLGIGMTAGAAQRENLEFEFIYEAEPLLTFVRTLSRPNVGLSLDTWHWKVGQGGIDQLSELNADQIVNVRLSDVPSDADLSKIKPGERMLPGTTEDSICGDVIKLLKEKGYTGPVTPCPALSKFTGTSRDLMVTRTRESVDTLLEAAGIEVTKSTFGGSSETTEEKAETEKKADAEGEAGDNDAKKDDEKKAEPAKA